MLPLGTAAPDFSLPDTVSGRDLSLADASEGKRGLLVMFICAHCPFVIHVQDELARLGDDYGSDGLGIVAISSNSVISHPQDAPDRLRAMASGLGFAFPYLYDESQAVAKSYTAAHAGLFPVRCGQPAGVPRPSRREPARQRTAC